MDGATTTVVGISAMIRLSPGSWDCSRGLATRRALDEAAILEDPSVALAGVDLVLFLPLLGDERKGELLGVVKDAPATADLPALSLSTDMKAQLDEQSDSVLPWPWSTEALVRRSSRPCVRLAETKRRVGSTVRVPPFRCVLALLPPSIDVSSILSAPPRIFSLSERPLFCSRRSSVCRASSRWGLRFARSSFRDVWARSGSSWRALVRALLGSHSWWFHPCSRSWRFGNPATSFRGP